LFDAISASQAEAERAGQADRLLLPSEHVLLCMVDLCTRDASEAEWADLAARSQATSVEQELIEVVEMAARALGRRGHIERARRMLDQALALAEKIPNVMEKRLAQAQTQWRAGATVSRAG
jgi:hypothetical protein